MAQKTVQVFYAPAKAACATPQRTVLATIVRALLAPLLWLAAANGRARQRLRFQDLPPDLQRDLGFREESRQSPLREGGNVRFPDWS